MKIDQGVAGSDGTLQLPGIPTVLWNLRIAGQRAGGAAARPPAGTRGRARHGTALHVCAMCAHLSPRVFTSVLFTPRTVVSADVARDT